MPKAKEQPIRLSSAPLGDGLIPRLPIGCHVSIAGGVFNAPKNAADLGCETFQIFTRSPQGGPAPELKPEVVEKFNAEMEKYKFDTFVVHCPYYINFGSAKPQTFHGSASIVRGELDRTSLLGGSYVMFHTGSGKDLGTEAAIAQSQKGLIKVLEGYNGSAKLLVEIAAGAGEILGDTFEEIAEIMEPLKKYPGFGGVCFDTQHAFSSGYDLRDAKSIEATFKKFDKIIGLEYLKMSHMNDSKTELAGRKDRHDHIGEGKIGKEGFAALLEFLDKGLSSLPLILETEHDKVKEDIEILKSLRDMLKK